MTNYSLRARMMILILAPTVLIGLLLSIFFVVHRYNDLQRQLEDAGASIIEPLAVSSEYGMNLQNRESIGQLISVLHRRHSDIVRAISVYDDHNRLFVTSNFHLTLTDAASRRSAVSTSSERRSPRRYYDSAHPDYLGELFAGRVSDC
ncbi:Signal transduction histidine-protein kinase BarA [Salmonella enterica subsp. enterica serovar Napoli]|nr:Signal transduction histidine-protein kinase BarA [Salmonella enterica subsp. enterica serovar Napoli]